MATKSSLPLPFRGFEDFCEKHTRATEIFFRLTGLTRRLAYDYVKKEGPTWIRMKNLIKMIEVFYDLWGNQAEEFFVICPMSDQLSFIQTLEQAMRGNRGSSHSTAEIRRFIAENEAHILLKIEQKILRSRVKHPTK